MRIALIGAVGLFLSGCASSGDPNVDWARGVLTLVRDSATIQEQRRFREAQAHHTSLQLNAVEEKKTPYLDSFRYPQDWPAISDLRDRPDIN